MWRYGIKPLSILTNYWILFKQKGDAMGKIFGYIFEDLSEIKHRQIRQQRTLRRTAIVGLVIFAISEIRAHKDRIELARLRDELEEYKQLKEA